MAVRVGNVAHAMADASRAVDTGRWFDLVLLSDVPSAGIGPVSECKPVSAHSGDFGTSH